MHLIIRALVYLAMGVVFEVTFTALRSLIYEKDWRLEGFVPMWNMPLYALGGVFIFESLHLQMMDWNILVRFCIYAILIFTIEFIAGFVFEKIIGKCPWDYSGILVIKGYIKLTYFPAWGAVGLCFEVVHNYMRSFV